MTKISFIWNEKLAARLADAAERRVLGVGIPKTAKYPDGTKVEDVAFMQEFGDGNVPPRSFVRTTMADRANDFRDAAREALGKSVRGVRKPKKSLEELGNGIRDAFVAAIDNLHAPALKPATVAHKAAEGCADPEKPLVESGLMRNSLAVEVKE